MKIINNSLFTQASMLGHLFADISKTHLILTRQSPLRPPPPRPPLPPPPLPPPPLGVQKTCPTRTESARVDRTDLMAPDVSRISQTSLALLLLAKCGLSSLSDHTCDRLQIFIFQKNLTFGSFLNTILVWLHKKA